MVYRFDCVSVMLQACFLDENSQLKSIVVVGLDLNWLKDGNGEYYWSVAKRDTLFEFLLVSRYWVVSFTGLKIWSRKLGVIRVRILRRLIVSGMSCEKELLWM